jgi:hypothetical protein
LFGCEEAILRLGDLVEIPARFGFAHLLA